MFWWDADLEVRCVRRAGHDDLHRDGIRWFDELGYQQPQPEPAEPSLLDDHRGHTAGWKERSGRERSRSPHRKDFAA